jgi:phospholipase C
MGYSQITHVFVLMLENHSFDNVWSSPGFVDI